MFKRYIYIFYLCENSKKEKKEKVILNQSLRRRSLHSCILLLLQQEYKLVQEVVKTFIESRESRDVENIYYNQ